MILNDEIVYAKYNYFEKVKIFTAKYANYFY